MCVTSVHVRLAGLEVKPWDWQPARLSSFTPERFPSPGEAGSGAQRCEQASPILVRLTVWSHRLRGPPGLRVALLAVRSVAVY